MKITLAIVLLWILSAGCGTRAEAVCAGMAVNAFGAKGDGHTDDTAAIQSAINAAAAAGGGSVVFNVANYFTSGTLTVPQSVVLCGAIEGPFDVGGSMPVASGFAVGPTLLVTSTGGPFITLQGPGAGVTDMVFYYPTQLTHTAAAPNPFPYTILMTAPGQKVARSTAANAYNFLDIESGRTLATDLFIGAFNVGINIDHAYDHVTLRNILNQVFWDVVDNSNYPQPIDTWVRNHGIALVVNRVDSLEVHDFLLFSKSVGMLLTDSPDAAQNPRCGFGSGSDIDFDTVQFGIIATASNTAGYKFTSVDIGADPSFGQAAVQLRAGGSMPPQVEINGGSERAFAWALGPFPAAAAGKMTILNIIGFNVP